jgi:hypothetical protein
VRGESYRVAPGALPLRTKGWEEIPRRAWLSRDAG